MTTLSHRLTDSWTFLVLGDPVPYVRQSQRDKWEHRPAVERYRAWADLVRGTARRRLPFTAPLEGPVWVGFLFDLSVPASWSKKKRTGAVSFPPETFPITRSGGDLDNLVKGVCDALNGIAWVDDAQLIGFSSTWKRYSTKPGVLITLSDDVDAFFGVAQSARSVGDGQP